MVLQSDYPEEELVGMDLYTIMRVFKRIWEKHQNNLSKPKHVIRKYPYTVEERKIQIIDRVKKEEKLDFITLALEINDRIYVIFTFLAILELVQTQKLYVTAGEGYNNFWIKEKAENVAEA